MNDKIKSSNFYINLPIPDYEQIINCMHCGMCLPTCPTYALTGNEIDSPRGRIRMIKAVAEGELDISSRFKESMNFCLNCQACVTSCPAGVEYGKMVEATHLHIAEHDRQTGAASPLKNFILNWVFADLRRLNFFAALLRFYQKIGLQKIVQGSAVLKLLSAKLHDMSYMAPVVPRRRPYNLYSSEPQTKTRGRVGILPGCVQDVFFRDVNQDTIDVLKINGYQVVVPEENICCGSVHGHNGNLEMAKSLARRMIDLFSKAKVDQVVLNSAGCGAYMKEYGHLLADDAEYAERAVLFSKNVLDISEFLVASGWRPPELKDRFSVTYHEPCHLVHTQKISQQPRELMKSISGMEFRELSESSWCCGSAGIYNITRYEDSMRVLERKMTNIKKTGADFVVTGNPGCMIQLMYGKKQFPVNIEILHPVSLLKKVYEIEGES